MNLPEANGTFLATIIDSVGDGVIVIDMEGRITLMNPAAEEITAISRRHALGQSFGAIFAGHEILSEMVSRTATTGITISDHENILIRRGNQLTPVSATTFPLILPNGQTIGTILMLRDLTNIRELEEAVRNADRLSTLGTLAAGLAHEIKNPLGGIRGAAQLLEMELPPDSELLDNVRIVVKEVDRVNRIVEELLELASPRRLRLSRVNLHRILGDILTLQKRGTGGKRVTFQQEFDPSIPPILADEEMLIRLFLNLVKNAVEAVQDGGLVRVASRVVSDYSMTHKGERRSRMVAIEVSDDGPGIPKEQLEQLFTPFFTTKAKGTGLGLVICQKIVSEHRGMLKVDSAPLKGTTFTVMLPLIQ